MESKSVGRLHEIDAAIRQIAVFTRGKTEADYLGDSLLRSAVLWQLVRICEPVRALPRDDVEAVQGIDRYRQMIGFRTFSSTATTESNTTSCRSTCETNCLDCEAMFGRCWMRPMIGRSRDGAA